MKQAQDDVLVTALVSGRVRATAVRIYGEGEEAVMAG